MYHMNDTVYLWTSCCVKMLRALLILCIILISASLCQQQPCIPKDYDEGSIVCVCNSTYCDTIEPTTLEQITKDSLRVYVTNKNGKRMEAMTLDFTPEYLPGNISVSFLQRLQNTPYQDISGFGGTMSDATAINIMSLSEGAQNLLIKQYFSSEGADYTFVRVPIGGSDFSTHEYAYDNDAVDETLQNFNLTLEDYTYKIPLLKRAQEASNNTLRLFATAWSAPPWMKEILDYGRYTYLKRQYYQLWADYIVKFLDFYSEEGLKFWGVTTQYEPSHGRMTLTAYNSMGWSAEQQRDWVVGNLGPTLRDKGYSDINVIILDDFAIFAHEWSMVFYLNGTASAYVTGMAVHWYPNCNPQDVSDYVSLVYDEHPWKFILYTETSYEGASLGNWTIAQKYASRMIEMTSSDVTGWIDSNLVLDLQGGPNWAKKFHNAPIFVNADTDEFYKQPEFYAIAHFSHFVPRGSVRLGLNYSNLRFLEFNSFLTPDNVTVIVVHNPTDADTTVRIEDALRGYVMIPISANSINTILYSQNVDPVLF